MISRAGGRTITLHSLNVFTCSTDTGGEAQQMQVRACETRPPAVQHRGPALPSERYPLPSPLSPLLPPPSSLLPPTCSTASGGRHSPPNGTPSPLLSSLIPPPPSPLPAVQHRGAGTALRTVPPPLSSLIPPPSSLLPPPPYLQYSIRGAGTALRTVPPPPPPPSSSLPLPSPPSSLLPHPPSHLPAAGIEGAGLGGTGSARWPGEGCSTDPNGAPSDESEQRARGKMGEGKRRRQTGTRRAACRLSACRSHGPARSESQQLRTDNRGHPFSGGSINNHDRHSGGGAGAGGCSYRSKNRTGDPSSRTQTSSATLLIFTFRLRRFYTLYINTIMLLLFNYAQLTPRRDSHNTLWLNILYRC